jgi:hypothetical protein
MDVEYQCIRRPGVHESTQDFMFPTRILGVQRCALLSRRMSQGLQSRHHVLYANNADGDKLCMLPNVSQYTTSFEGSTGLLCRGMTFNPNAGTINCQGIATDATNVVAGNSTISYTTPFIAVAQSVVVAWESSDLASFTPVSAPLLQVATSTSSSGADTTLSTPTTADTSLVAPSNGLPQNTKIGLGVSIACGVILVCAAVGLLVYRRRLRHLRSTPGNIRTTEDPNAAGVVTKAELGGDSYVHEIGGKQVLAEADDVHARHELEGN